MQPGLRRIAPGVAQLTPAGPCSRHLREKMAVLACFADQALVCAPAFDASPALRAIAREVEPVESAPFRFDGPGDCHAPGLGWALDRHRPQGQGDPGIGALLGALPLDRRSAALLCLAFEEDFAVIDGDSASIPWLAVCLPSRWAPEEKVGRHFAEVHAPVADSAMLTAASAQLARLVTGSDRWERFVWTISADPRLHQHPARCDARWPENADAAELAALASFRHEHQTFIPTGLGRQAVFTIRVFSEPLASAVRTRDAAVRLHEALASMTPAVVAYRGLAPARDRLLDWLGQRMQDLPAVAA